MMKKREGGIELLPTTEVELEYCEDLADLAEELGYQLKLYRDLRYQAGDAPSYLLTAYSAKLLVIAELLRYPPAAQQRLARSVMQQCLQYLKELRRDFDA